MSVETRTTYTVCCDECGKSADEGTEFVGWPSVDGAECTAEGYGYHRDGERWLCDACWLLDEGGE